MTLSFLTVWGTHRRGDLHYFEFDASRLDSQTIKLLKKKGIDREKMRLAHEVAYGLQEQKKDGYFRHIWKSNMNCTTSLTYFGRGVQTLLVQYPVRVIDVSSNFNVEWTAGHEMAFNWRI